MIKRLIGWEELKAQGPSRGGATTPHTHTWSTPHCTHKRCVASGDVMAWWRHVGVGECALMLMLVWAPSGRGESGLLGKHSHGSSASMMIRNRGKFWKLFTKAEKASRLHTMLKSLPRPFIVVETKRENKNKLFLRPGWGFLVRSQLTQWRKLFKIKGQGGESHSQEKENSCGRVNRREHAVETCAMTSLFWSWLALITVEQIFKYSVKILTKLLV